MLFFLKLGGSLITDKSRPRTARPDVIDRLSRQIAAALKAQPDLLLILGHGSGSFGHSSADRYGTREGVTNRKGWVGFSRVWYDAACLNHLVMGALHKAGIPAVAFPPSSSIVTRGREIADWQMDPLVAALERRLTPVVFGDVCFDTEMGGTILSTEELFTFLARQLKPDRILLAGDAPGVWADYPHCTKVMDSIHPEQLSELDSTLGHSGDTDVTGGMKAKIQETLNLIREQPGLDALVFSGAEPGALAAALRGELPGTHLQSTV